MEYIAKLNASSLCMDWTVSQRVTVLTKNVIMSKAVMESQQAFSFKLYVVQMFCFLY